MPKRQRFCLESKRSNKEDRKLQRRVFVPDLVKELADEGAKLREAVRCARRVFNLNAAISNNHFVMLDSGLSYKDIREYINKEMYKGPQSINQHHNLKSSLDIFKDMCIRPMN